MNSSFPTPASSEEPPRLGERVIYALKHLWRHVRVQRPITSLLGPQYRRSRECIEIDLTWACNMRCLNCNRSVRQAPTGEHMSLEQVQAFVAESRARHVRWRKIRLLGGEPTLHPQFLEIVELLCVYREELGGDLEIQVATNGHGPRVQAILARVEGRVTLDNSQKESDLQPHFGDFNVAPRDLASYRHADFRNACYVAQECGMGLTPYGYYGCAVAGGIDRVLGLDLGRKSLPEASEDLEEQLAALCAWCGRFKTGDFIPRGLRPPLEEERMTESWKQAYARWRADRPRLTRYGP